MAFTCFDHGTLTLFVQDLWCPSKHMTSFTLDRLDSERSWFLLPTPAALSCTCWEMHLDPKPTPHQCYPWIPSWSWWLLDPGFARENMKKKVQIFHVIDRQCLSFVAFFFHNSARCCKQQFLFVLDEWMCQTALFLHFNSKTTLAKQQHG